MLLRSEAERRIQLLGQIVIHALCFGLFFGFPFIIWGLILIVDRDRSWQKKLQRSRADQPPKRTSAWELRQSAYGALLVAFGIALILLLSLFNFLAQGISPPAPF